MPQHDSKALRRNALRRLGNRIAERRGGLTQEDLADRLGVSKNTVSRIETGTRELGVFELKQIAQALGTTVAQLLDEPEPAADQSGLPRSKGRPRSLRPDLLDESIRLLESSRRLLQEKGLQMIDESRELLERLRAGAT